MFKRFCTGMCLIFVVASTVVPWLTYHHGYNRATADHTTVLKNARLMYHKARNALMEVRTTPVGKPENEEEYEAYVKFDAERTKCRLGIYAAVAEGDLPRAQKWLTRLSTGTEAFLNKHHPGWEEELTTKK